MFLVAILRFHTKTMSAMTLYEMNTQIDSHVRQWTSQLVLSKNFVQAKSSIHQASVFILNNTEWNSFGLFSLSI